MRWSRAGDGEPRGARVPERDPGRVGATPIQNVGAYGQEVAETISRVRCFDRKTDSVVEIPAAECGFRYRDSRFKSEEPGRFLVLGVSYRLTRGGAPNVRYPELARRLGERPTLAETRDTVLAVRREKSMVLSVGDENARSCGSFFVNPVVDAARVAEIEAAAASGEMPRYPQPDGRVKLPAAWLIERAGFAKGTREGAVGLSTKHTLAVVAHGGARAGDVVAFARRVRRTVEQRFGVRLVPEPSFWGFSSLDDGLPDERMAYVPRQPQDVRTRGRRPRWPRRACRPRCRRLGPCPAGRPRSHRRWRRWGGSDRRP